MAGTPSDGETTEPVSKRTKFEGMARTSTSASAIQSHDSSIPVFECQTNPQNGSLWREEIRSSLATQQQQQQHHDHYAKESGSSQSVSLLPSELIGIVLDYCSCGMQFVIPPAPRWSGSKPVHFSKHFRSASTGVQDDLSYHFIRTDFEFKLSRKQRTSSSSSSSGGEDRTQIFVPSRLPITSVSASVVACTLYVDSAGVCQEHWYFGARASGFVGLGVISTASAARASVGPSKLTDDINELPLFGPVLTAADGGMIITNRGIVIRNGTGRQLKKETLQEWGSTDDVAWEDGFQSGQTVHLEIRLNPNQDQKQNDFHSDSGGSTGSTGSTSSVDATVSLFVNGHSTPVRFSTAAGQWRLDRDRSYCFVVALFRGNEDPDDNTAAAAVTLL